MLIVPVYVGRKRVQCACMCVGGGREIEGETEAERGKSNFTRVGSTVGLALLSSRVDTEWSFALIFYFLLYLLFQFLSDEHN